MTKVYGDTSDHSPCYHAGCPQFASEPFVCFDGALVYYCREHIKAPISIRQSHIRAGIKRNPLSHVHMLYRHMFHTTN